MHGIYKIKYLNPWIWIRQNQYYIEIKWNVYHMYCLFQFFYVQTSKKLFHWIIVQTDKNSISTCAYEMNLIYLLKYSKKVSTSRFVVVEMYSYICWRVFPLLWYFGKKYTTTIGTIALTYVPLFSTKCNYFFKNKFQSANFSKCVVKTLWNVFFISITIFWLLIFYRVFQCLKYILLIKRYYMDAIHVVLWANVR